MQIELIVDAKARLGESPFWHASEQRVYWVDIERGVVHCHDPRGEADIQYKVGCRVGAAVPRRTGGLLLATEFGFEAFDLESQRRETLVDPESDLPDNRFNDGKCDARGRYWAGTMSMVRETGAGSLYVLGTKHSVRKVVEKVTTSNGLGWSPDGKTMYYIDTPTLQVSAFDYDAAAGAIGNRRAIITFPSGVGRPDGMTVDDEGMLWIAHWDGGRISRWDPANASLLKEVTVPANRVTSCAFGGAGLDELYVTTAREGLTAEQLEEQPHAGGLFRLRPGVSGAATHEYWG